MNYYLIQYKREIWLDTNMILVGDIQKHLTTVEGFEKKFHNTYRLRRITEDMARQLSEKQGYVIYRSPEKLNDV